jgi:hypothetical protein
MDKHRILLVYSEAEKRYHASLPEAPGCHGSGPTPEEAVAALRASVTGHPGLPAPVTLGVHTETTLINMPLTLHESLARIAAREGITLNQLIISILSEWRHAGSI